MAYHLSQLISKNTVIFHGIWAEIPTQTFWPETSCFSQMFPDYQFRSMFSQSFKFFNSFVEPVFLAYFFAILL